MMDAQLPNMPIEEDVAVQIHEKNRLTAIECFQTISYGKTEEKKNFVAQLEARNVNFVMHD